MIVFSGNWSAFRVGASAARLFETAVRGEEGEPGAGDFSESKATFRSPAYAPRRAVYDCCFGPGGRELVGLLTNCDSKSRRHPMRPPGPSKCQTKNRFSKTMMSNALPGEIRLIGGGRRLTVEIEGQIGLPEGWLSEEESSRSATYESFRRQLDRLGRSTARRIEVHIRSTGGNVQDALLIYETLCNLASAGAEITTLCSGYTASAATLVAQAATSGCRLVSANALYLIHNATTTLEGNSLDAEHTFRLLGETDARLAEIYAGRSGRSAEEFRELMARNGGRGEWLSATEAVSAGLADRVHRISPLAEVRNRVSARIRGWFGTPSRSDQEQESERGSERVASAGALAPEVRSAAALGSDLRARISPSTTRPREDPAVLTAGMLGAGLSEETSRNGQAYESDALRLRRGC